MNWKDFFKPTIGKIIVAILISIIPVAKYTICPFLPPCFTEIILVFQKLSLIFNKTFNESLAGPSVLIGYFLTMVLVYITSCIFVLLLKKIVNRLKSTVK